MESCSRDSGVVDSGIWSLGSGVEDLEQNLESGIWSLEAGVWKRESWNQEAVLESGILSLESGSWKPESGIASLESWCLEAGVVESGVLEFLTYSVEAGVWNLEA